MKKYFSTFFALFCFFVLCFCVGVYGADSGLEEQICPEVLRFHILANSNSDDDQQLKIVVRDEIAPLMNQLFENCKNVDEALCVANKNTKLIKKVAESVLLKNECMQSVQVVVGQEHYPEKSYKGMSFPEGEYLSLRIILGNGFGQNWWCVLFPSFSDIGIEYEENGVETKKENTVEMFGCRVKLKFLEYFK